MILVYCCWFMYALSSICCRFLLVCLSVRFSIEQNRPSTQSQALDLNRPPEAPTSRAQRPHTAGGIGHDGDPQLHPYIRNILVQGNGRSTVKSVSPPSRRRVEGSTVRRSIHHFLPLQPLESSDPRAAPLPIQLHHNHHHHSSSTGSRGTKSTTTAMVPYHPELVNVLDNDSMTGGFGGPGLGSVDGTDSLVSDIREGSVGQLTGGSGTGTDDHDMRQGSEGGSPVAVRAAGTGSRRRNGGNAASGGSSAVLLQEPSLLSSARWAAVT